VLAASPSEAAVVAATGVHGQPAETPDRTVSQVQGKATLIAAGIAGTQTGRAGVRQPRSAAAAPVAATPGITYRVYANREGLVGGTTANGHVIVARDHFVALPSRRGLSAKDTGDFTVRVCTTSGSRCEYAPVWDVGPWNTKDDYWNLSGTRELSKDLPQGKPETQAAYQDRYNGGKSQAGRTVTNPAGIDLADGTFWDGLLLTDNAWVDVTYLWTGTGVRGQVVGGLLNVRTGPGSSYAIKGLAVHYASVPIECWVTGQPVSGPHGTTARWNRIAAGQYISDAYISSVRGGSVPAC
jgi:hypothetical protein